MKSYKEILTELKDRKPKGEVVFDKKIKRIPVLIVKDKGTLPFVVYIDGDRLDAFKSQKDAEKSAEKVIKELT
jgi:hypothetical protein|tara:strand:+ start:113 stop:331 length:219 start_codon:yes stop_codon:yes gene_type:complete